MAEIAQVPSALQAADQQNRWSPELEPAPVTIQLASNQELSTKLSWPSAKLLTLLGKNKQLHYSKLSLRKKGSSGKLRILHNPSGLMRAAQYKILTEVLETVPVPDYIHAFERGRSIPAMASQHVGKGVVISLDLKDFFTSIKQYHLESIFRHLGVSEKPARLLSELCTYQSFVPQGAITSPKVSNIVTSLTFGPAIRRFCEQRGYTLTIYADDITISAEEDLVAVHGYSIIREIVRFVQRTVRQYGFRLNSEKTKIMRPNTRQYVCGVVVNERTNLQQKERRKLRAIVHNCAVHGIASQAQKSGQSEDSFVASVQGRLNWFSQLNDEAGKQLRDRFLQLVRQHRLDLEAKDLAQLETVENSTGPGLGDCSTTDTLPWE